MGAPRGFGRTLTRRAQAIHTALLTVCFVISVAVRLVPLWKFGWVLQEHDPYFNFRAAQYLEELGSAAFRNWFDRTVWYPLGRPVGTTVYPGIMHTAVALYRVAQMLGLRLNLEEVCILVGPLFAPLTTWATHRLVMEATGDSWAALSAAALFSIVPAHVARSTAGWFDNEAVAMFPLVLSLALYLRAIRTGSPLASAGCALSLGYTASCWGGYVYPVNLIALHALALVALGRFSRQLYAAVAPTAAAATLLFASVPIIGRNAVSSGEHVLLLLAFIAVHAAGAAALLRAALPRPHFRAASGLLLVSGAIVAASAAMLYGLPSAGISARAASILGLAGGGRGAAQDPLHASVSEHRPADLEHFKLDFHAVLILAGVGVVSMAQALSDGHLLLCLYAVTSALFTARMSRLAILMAPGACAAAGAGLAQCFRAVSAVGGGGAAKAASGRAPRPAVPLVGPFAAALAGLLISYCLHCSWAATEVYGRPEILPRILDEDGRPATADDFREAFAWLRGHTDPQSAVVCSWWDYGYQLSAVARRATCVDNNTWNATHIGRVGLAFASPEGRAWELLRDLGATHVLVVFGGRSGYAADDINKLPWMARVARAAFPHEAGVARGEVPFLDRGVAVRVGAGAPEPMRRSLVYRLSFFRFNDAGTEGACKVRRGTVDDAEDIALTHFDEAYTSKNWLVRRRRRRLGAVRAHIERLRPAGAGG